MNKIINMTPHPVHIIGEDDQVLRTFEFSGTMIRLKANTIDAGLIDCVKCTRTSFGSPEGLPEEKDGVYYIVSQLVHSALPERNDLLVPAEVVRDSKGNIIGCRSLGRQ